MPDFEVGDVLAIISPTTVVAVACASIVFAHFLWLLIPHVEGQSLLRGYIGGLGFLVVMAAGRWATGSPHWEAWLGTIVLWSVYIGGAWTAIRFYRHVRAVPPPPARRLDPDG